MSEQSDSTKCLLCGFPIPQDGDEMCQQCRQGEIENPEHAFSEATLQELRDAR